MTGPGSLHIQVISTPARTDKGVGRGVRTVIGVDPLRGQPVDGIDCPDCALARQALSLEGRGQSMRFIDARYDIPHHSK